MLLSKNDPDFDNLSQLWHFTCGCRVTFYMSWKCGETLSLSMWRIEVHLLKDSDFYGLTYSTEFLACHPNTNSQKYLWNFKVIPMRCDEWIIHDSRWLLDLLHVLSLYSSYLFVFIQHRSKIMWQNKNLN